MNENEEQTFIANIRLNLDESIIDLNRNISARLNEGRHFALKQQRRTNYSATEELTLNIQSELDASIDDLPADILSRLNQIRSAAVAQKTVTVKTRQGFWSFFTKPRIYIPASSFATACVLVLVVSMVYLLPEQNTLPLPFSGDSFAGGSISMEIGLLASSDELELYENLDFYLWLADNGLQN